MQVINEIPKWYALRNPKPKMHFEIPNWNALRNPKPRMHYEILNREAKRNSNRKYNTKGEVLEVTEPLSDTPKWQIAFRYLNSIHSCEIKSKFNSEIKMTKCELP